MVLDKLQHASAPPRAALGRGQAAAAPQGAPFGVPQAPDSWAPSAPTYPGLAAALGAQPLLQRAEVAEHLRYIVRVNRLACFYPDDAALERLAAQVAVIDFGTLQAECQLPPAELLKLTALCLYDTVVYADDSSSMAWDNPPDARGVSTCRWQQLRTIFDRITRIAAHFDADGIDICFFNSDKVGCGIGPDGLDGFLSDVRPRGTTPMASGLDLKILAPLRRSIAADELARPVLVHTITDGAPYPEDPQDTHTRILETQAFLRAHGLPDATIAYGFAQIGDDAAATAYLDGLDNDAAIGRQVDTTSDYTTERAQCGGVLSHGAYVAKMLVGPIDPRVDQQDQQDVQHQPNAAPPPGAPASQAAWRAAPGGSQGTGWTPEPKSGQGLLAWLRG